MPDYLGIDTSNYTTSAAVYISEENRIVQAKKLLPVKAGELGLRQSDAVFHHTKQLPDMIEQLSAQYSDISPSVVTASARPRNIEGSYMPCFLVGEGFGRSLAAVEHIPLYTTSHQIGHILAALYSADRLDLIRQPFIAFHVSGGTTDCLFCEPDEEDVLRITEAGTSLDLKAGQAVDRTGVMLGLRFPCGPELEKLAAGADKRIKTKAVLKDGNCCLSGVENKCRTMLEKGESPENIARYCLDTIAETIAAMTSSALERYGSLPLVFAGGVMSDVIIRDRLLEKFPGADFAEPQFSCDNAAGMAIFGYLKSNGVK
ncbi:peptidase M22 [Ruminococcus sp. XPD3002]|uniref:peptidase M22 n=1 Tax=Ruminococcus sp. XPD3002 TaxID=1452269 RepID=UPI00091C143D|nr:N6-L-threonylcarbamoyladenine synthase [Ruminococcus flavefaciens]